MKTEEKSSFGIRLKDSLEFLETAGDAFVKKRYKATVMNAGDAAIAANDAFTIFFLRQKASSDHREALMLHKDAGKKVNENQLALLKYLIDHRHKDGYRAVIVSKSVAEESVKKAEKFVKWVKKIIRR